MQVHEKYWPLKLGKVKMMQPESESLKQNTEHFKENVVFFSVWTPSTYDPTITDSLRVSISDVPLHGLYYSSVTCGALHPAECSGHSGQHPLPPLPGPRQSIPRIHTQLSDLPPVLNRPYLLNWRDFITLQCLNTKSYTVFEQNIANCCHCFTPLHWGLKMYCL